MSKEELKDLGFREMLCNRYLTLTINNMHQIYKSEEDDFVVVYIGALKQYKNGEYAEGESIEMPNVNTIEKVKKLIELLK